MLACLKKLFSIVLNAGWIVPLYLSVNAIIQWCRLEASPVIYGTEGTVNSFPFLQFAQETLVVACIWLAVAVIVNTLRRRPVINELGPVADLAPR